MSGEHRAFAPTGHARWEMLIMRIGFALAVLSVLFGNIPDGDPTHPVGLQRWFDLRFIADAQGLWIGVASLALALYALGVLPAVSLAVGGFVFIGYGSLQNSFGSSQHHLQTAGLIMLAQAIWYAWRACAEPRRALYPSIETQQSAAHIARQVIAGVYVTTAITKLWASDFEWIKKAKYYPLQIEKTKWSGYYNKLQEEWDDGLLSGIVGPIRDFLVDHPDICRAVIGSGLILELFAFLALIGRRWALFYGLALIGFHLTVGRVMNLHFTLNMLAILVFMVNAPYWIARIATRGGKAGAAPAEAANAHG